MKYDMVGEFYDSFRLLCRVNTAYLSLDMKIQSGRTSVSVEGDTGMSRVTSMSSRRSTRFRCFWVAKRMTLLPASLQSSTSLTSLAFN